MSLPKEFVKYVEDAIASQNNSNEVIKMVSSEGKEQWLQETIMPIFDPLNNKVGEVIVRYDITEKEKYKKMAITDPLTQLFNRRYYNQIIQEQMEKSLTNKQLLGHIVLDIDFFKKYNDTYGHSAGDDALVSVANI